MCLGSSPILCPNIMKTFILLLGLSVIGCARYPIPQDYKITQTYKKCDSNGNCKLVTEEVR